MRNIMKKIMRGVMFALLAVVFVVVFGFVVRSLWNWLMPALFGWRLITFWQAMGILVLTRILFGGFRGRPGHHGHWRRRMMERWEQMTPEEREKFREGFRGRCSPFRQPPAAEPKSPTA
jgi:small-conductance mechanosensitive channel